MVEEMNNTTIATELVNQMNNPDCELGILYSLKYIVFTIALMIVYLIISHGISLLFLKL
jgi:hypothetical protein